jgi:lysophospholipase L1-like esterase
MLRKSGKIALTLFLGAVATILIVELLLFAGGLVFKDNKENVNQELIRKGEGNKVIFCLGDSTTAIGGKESWPYQLQEMLDEENSNYTVLNRGRVLADSSDVVGILEGRDDSLDIEYIVVMSGINDVKEAREGGEKEMIWEKTRTYNLVQLLLPRLFGNTEYIGTKDIAEQESLRRNYRRLQEIADSISARLVIMQYPGRDISPLREIFDSPEEIIFVENKKPFQEAWEEGGYEQYFVDRFGGDFGHCTPRGNRIIAENLYEKLFKQD